MMEEDHILTAVMAPTGGRADWGISRVKLGGWGHSLEVATHFPEWIKSLLLLTSPFGNPRVSLENLAVEISLEVMFGMISL